jgi:type II secretory pathway pseudopilin PulG
LPAPPESGFAVAELLVALAIVALIATVAVIATTGTRAPAQATRAQELVQAAAARLAAFAENHDDGLASLTAGTASALLGLPVSLDPGSPPAGTAYVSVTAGGLQGTVGDCVPGYFQTGGALCEEATLYAHGASGANDAVDGFAVYCLPTPACPAGAPTAAAPVTSRTEWPPLPSR